MVYQQFHKEQVGAWGYLLKCVLGEFQVLI